MIHFGTSPGDARFRRLLTLPCETRLDETESVMTEAVASGASSLAALGRVREAAGPSHAGVAQALSRASADTGVGFDFLYRVASRESSLNPEAKAATSSAAGLFQFIEQTWLRLVKTYGEAHGLGGFAAEIARTPEGRYAVSNPERKVEILNARYDAGKAAALAAELARENRGALEGALGRPVDGAELYAAHFLGAGGAARLLASAPDAAAADILPEAARANRNVFYDGARARSAGELIESFRHAIGEAPGREPRSVAPLPGAPAGTPTAIEAQGARLAVAAPAPGEVDDAVRFSLAGFSTPAHRVEGGSLREPPRGLPSVARLASAPELRDPPVPGVRRARAAATAAAATPAGAIPELESVYGRYLLSPYALVALQTLDPTRLRDRSRG